MLHQKTLDKRHLDDCSLLRNDADDKPTKFNELLEDSSIYDLPERKLQEVTDHYLWLQKQLDRLQKSQKIAPICKQVKSE